MTFLDLGFAPIVTACTATPDKDGYLGERDDMPYHIHPTATPLKWSLLADAIKDGSVTIKAYVVLVVTNDQALATLRAERNILLADSDWTHLADSPLTTEAKASWATYRKALRDLPATYANNANSAVFPALPSGV